MDDIQGQFYVYPSGLLKDKWRWRYVSKNGRKIYATTESYENLQDCINTIPHLQSRPRSWIVLDRHGKPKKRKA
jgi:uncharacterized protein YegP (UPF0339 family)